MLSWQDTFTKGSTAWRDAWTLKDPVVLHNITALKNFLDLVHIRYGLVKPYLENKNYPLIEARELLPSFEADMFEHKNLPGYSLVAFDRPLNYFQEVFQFDILPSITSESGEREAEETINRNMQTLQNRMHKAMHVELLDKFSRVDVGNLDVYPALQPFLQEMDRAQVIAMNGEDGSKNNFRLHGVYASFPSDLDTEIKRFGLKTGKFAIGNNDLYDANRLFVYQFLMELYGFPISSERRTSAALFARRLHKMGEKFLVRTLGQSDRTITTMWNDGSGRQYPKVEKTALVALDKDQTDLLPILKDGGYFIDPKNRVVILRVKYKQHKFNADNVRQDRALSVDTQEIIHPITGEPLLDVNIIKDTTNMFLRLNDIVRGEYNGYIVYKRRELIENTDTEEKKLKFLYAWLSKHQRRMIGYSDDFFGNMSKVLDTYLLAPEHYETFTAMNDLYQEVLGKYSYIHQARKIRMLEDLQTRHFKGNRIDYATMLEEVNRLLHSLKFEIVSYFDSLVANIISIGETILADRYLRSKYIDKKDATATVRQQSIRKNYGRLVALVDEFKAIRKTRLEVQKNLHQHNTAGK